MNVLDEFKRWESANLTKKEKQELRGFDEKKIKENFTEEISFGTAGMRGTVELGISKMNRFTVKRATEGVSKFILEKKKAKRGVVISYDTRRMSKEFAILVAKTLSYYGIKAYIFSDVHPVPMCSFAIRHLKAYMGIMITASHNPKEYNGYKVYGEDGAQLSPEDTNEVVKYIKQIDYFTTDIPIEKISLSGKEGTKLDENIEVISNKVDEAYYKALQKLVLSKKELKEYGPKCKIVYTPLHGSGYIPVTTILGRIGLKVKVVPEQKDPDTEFSTVKVPNPEMPDALDMGIKLAKKVNATVVMGTDPDCDRLGVAVKNDEGEYVLLNGNQIGALLLDYILFKNQQNKTLPKNAAFVKTIVTTRLAKRIGAHYKTKCFDVLTGFKFIGEKIKEWEKSGKYTFMFGYEESFGYLCGTHSRDKDAAVSSMLFAEMTCFYQSIGKTVYQRLQELFEEYGYFVEKTLNFVYMGLEGKATMNRIMKKLDSFVPETLGGLKVENTEFYNRRERIFPDGKVTKILLPKTSACFYNLENDNWVAIRPSGTEPKLKAYIATNAKSKKEAEELNEKIKKAIQKILH